MIEGRKFSSGSSPIAKLELGSDRFTGQAMTLDQDLANACDVERSFHFVVRNINSIHASDGSAFNANEMWMAAAVVRWIANFESPNVVTQLGPANQFGIGQVA